MRERQFLFLSLSLTALLMTACDPPGKPEAVDKEFIDRRTITDFKTLYESNCAGCHGMDGRNGAARTLNDPFYLAFLPKDSLRQIVEYGRAGTSMPAWALKQGGPLTDEQVTVVVDGIYSNWAKPQNYKSATLLPYAATADGDAVHGKRLFFRSCLGCHIKGGLAGPITERSYASLVSNQYVRSSIVAGRPDLGMPNYTVLGAGKPLSDGDVNDLTAYVASFRPAGIVMGGYTGKDATAQDAATQGSANGPGSARPQKEYEGNKVRGSSQGGIK